MVREKMNGDQKDKHGMANRGWVSGRDEETNKRPPRRRGAAGFLNP